MRRFLRSTISKLDDAELLRRYREGGDLEILAALYSRYLELVYGLCLKYLGDEHRAEDAAMAIYQELVSKVAGHEIYHFRNWLYSFVRNHCLMELRRDKKDLTIAFDPRLMYSGETLHPIQEDNPLDNQDEQLRECLGGLSEQQKNCIELFYYQDKSYKEIAEMRDEPLGAVRSHLQNGRRNLRLCMDKKATTP